MVTMESPRLAQARRGRIASLRDLAHAERLAGQPLDAREHALQALAFADALELNDQAAACLFLLGMISLREANANRAHAELARGLAAAISGRAYLIAAFCCQELGSIALRDGDTNAAAEYSAGAEDAFCRTPGYQISRDNLARVTAQGDDLREAS